MFCKKYLEFKVCLDFSLELNAKFIRTTPLQIEQSKMLSLTSTTIFKCNPSFQIEYTWLVNKIDASTTIPTTSIDLSSNPSSKSSQIFFQSNSLDYGLYEINLRVKITPYSYPVIEKDVSTFVQIIPSRIGVYPLINGIQTLRIGLEQTLILDPRKYSQFYDKISANNNPIQDLNFTFVCNLINPSGSTSSTLNDLLTLKTNGAPSSCFKSNGIKISLKIFKYFKALKIFLFFRFIFI